MYFICKEQAFTLIELIITIAVLAILTSIAIPSYHHYMEYQEYNGLLSMIRSHINLSKNYAVLYHNQVTICSSSDFRSCENNQWDKAMLIFSDQNHNKKLDADEQLYTVMITNLKYGSLKWKGFGDPNSISFMGDTGLPRGSQGSFYYCSFNTPKNSTRFILSPMGHLRTESTHCP